MPRRTEPRCACRRAVVAITGRPDRDLPLGKPRRLAPAGRAARCGCSTPPRDVAGAAGARRPGAFRAGDAGRITTRSKPRCSARGRPRCGCASAELPQAGGRAMSTSLARGRLARRASLGAGPRPARLAPRRRAAGPARSTRRLLRVRQSRWSATPATRRRSNVSWPARTCAASDGRCAWPWPAMRRSRLASARRATRCCRPGAALTLRRRRRCCVGAPRWRRGRIAVVAVDGLRVPLVLGSALDLCACRDSAASTAARWPPATRLPAARPAAGPTLARRARRRRRFGRGRPDPRRARPAGRPLRRRPLWPLLHRAGYRVSRDADRMGAAAGRPGAGAPGAPTSSPTPPCPARSRCPATASRSCCWPTPRRSAATPRSPP